MDPALWKTGPNPVGRQLLSPDFVSVSRYLAGMSSIAFKQAAAAWDAVAEHSDQPTELLNVSQAMEQLERVETMERILTALRHELINQLAGASVDELGGALRRVLADRLRIRRSEAGRRIEEAADLAPRLTLTGEPLPPKLEATAAGQREGSISGEHVKIIRGFLAQLPSFLDEPTRADAEQKLAAVAASYRPDELQRFADHLDLVLNPDGHFSDEDRARRRGITVGPQGTDGMSRLSGWLNPELRAGLDAVLAKWAAPGMCNPTAESPMVEGTPSPEVIGRDARSAAQRNHDAFNAIVRSTLMSGELGSHQGMPVTIIATATLEDLQAKTGVAHTGGGTLLPMRDVIRMAAHAYNYLLIFDKAKCCELFKGRTTRLATPEQRLVLYATERGCTHPGCDIPAYWCQVHHVNDWRRGGRTDIDNLTLACGPDNRLADQNGWRTRKNARGETEWLPPPDLRPHNLGQPRSNTYHHPEKLLPDDEQDGEAP
jgi:hypothetical protein